MLNDLASIIEVVDEPKAAAGGPLAGMTLCLTGSLQRPRKEVQLTIKAAGGKVVGSVSSQLDVLVAGEKAGSKLAKAEKLGLTVWTEQQLHEACQGDDRPVAEQGLAEENQGATQPQSTDSKQPSLFDY